MTRGLGPETCRQVCTVKHGTDTLKYDTVTAFNNATVLRRAMHRQTLLRATLHRVTLELVAGELPSTIGVQDFGAGAIRSRRASSGAMFFLLIEYEGHARMAV